MSTRSNLLEVIAFLFVSRGLRLAIYFKIACINQCLMIWWSASNENIEINWKFQEIPTQTGKHKPRVFKFRNITMYNSFTSLSLFMISHCHHLRSVILSYGFRFWHFLPSISNVVMCPLWSRFNFELFTITYTIIAVPLKHNLLLFQVFAHSMTCCLTVWLLRNICGSLPS